MRGGDWGCVAHARHGRSQGLRARVEPNLLVWKGGYESCGEGEKKKGIAGGHVS